MTQKAKKNTSLTKVSRKSLNSSGWLPPREDLEKLTRINIGDRAFLQVNPLSPRKLFSIVLQF